jgi:hypothetical protein
MPAWISSGGSRFPPWLLFVAVFSRSGSPSRNHVSHGTETWRRR